MERMTDTTLPPNFDLNHEILFLNIMLSNPDMFTRCANILDARYFDNQLKQTISFILGYYNEHQGLPEPSILKTSTGYESQPVAMDRADREWFLNCIEHFCRYRAIELAVWEAPKILEKKNYAELEQKVRDAVLITLMKDLGLDYWDDPIARLQAIKANSGTLSTKFQDFDKKLYGGFNRKELEIVCANSGVGKSIFLQNLAVNYAEQKLNVVYISLELSEEMISKRLDSMLTGIPTFEIMRRMEDVDESLRAKKAEHGHIWVKEMQSGSKANDIVAYLEQFYLQNKFWPDVLCVDYLDLMGPNNKSIDAGNLWVKDKYVSEELRGIARQFNLLLCTAAQLGRTALDQQVHGQEHIQGGISKINTADNVFSILVTPAMQQRNEWQIQFLKTRSSAGVGSRLSLRFDPDTLRLHNWDGDPSEGYTSSTLQALQRAVTVSGEQPNTEPNPEPTTMRTTIAPTLKGLVSTSFNDLVRQGLR